MKKPFLPCCIVLLILLSGGLQPLPAQGLLAFNHSEKKGAPIQQEVNSLIALLSKLEQKHSTNFIYERSLLENKTWKGSIEEKERLESVLKKVLPGANLRYKKLKGGGYAILPDQPDTPAPKVLEKDALKNPESTVSRPEVLHVNISGGTSADRTKALVMEKI